MSEVPVNAARLPVAVDIVALTVMNTKLMVLLATRLLSPYKGQSCLPGGFVLDGETLDQAASRELAEETGLDAAGHLEQLATFGPLGRDPRGPVLSVAYLAFHSFTDLPQAGGDAVAAAWTPVDSLPPLAFDHDVILAAGLERARAKLEYSGLATAFCADTFTISDLRNVYEAVWGVKLDPRNFNRKVTRTPNFLESVAIREGLPGHPAMLYRIASHQDPVSVILNPPIMRPTI